MENIRELSLSTCEHVWKCNSHLTDRETEAELHYASYLAAPKSIEECVNLDFPTLNNLIFGTERKFGPISSKQT